MTNTALEGGTFVPCLYDEYSTGGAFDAPTQNAISTCIYTCTEDSKNLDTCDVYIYMYREQNVKMHALITFHFSKGQLLQSFHNSCNELCVIFDGHYMYYVAEN